MEQRIIDFIAGLRAAGVRISIAESQDAFNATKCMGILDRTDFCDSLRTTLVKEALKRDMAIRDIAIEKAKAGQLKHRDNGQPVSPEEIEGALNDMRRLTESGIA